MPGARRLGQQYRRVLRIQPAATNNGCHHPLDPRDLGLSRKAPFRIENCSCVGEFSGELSDELIDENVDSLGELIGSYSLPDGMVESGMTGGSDPQEDHFPLREL
jgi:hypothetical protein